MNTEQRLRAVFFRTDSGNEPVREWLEGLGVEDERRIDMNKHRGGNFDDYLKEKGITEEVSALAQKRWETLRTETSSESESSTEVTDSSPGYINRLLIRLRHIFNHLFS